MKVAAALTCCAKPEPTGNFIDLDLNTVPHCATAVNAVIRQQG